MSVEEELYLFWIVINRQKAIYRTLLEEPGACDYAINLRGMA